MPRCAVAGAGPQTAHSISARHRSDSQDRCLVRPPRSPPILSPGWAFWHCSRWVAASTCSARRPRAPPKRTPSVAAWKPRRVTRGVTEAASWVFLATRAAITSVTVDARPVLPLAKWEASASATRLLAPKLPPRVPPRANAARAIQSMCAICTPVGGPTPRRAGRERITDFRTRQIKAQGLR